MGIAVTHEPVGAPVVIGRGNYNGDQHLVELTGGLAAIDGIGTGLSGKIARFLSDNSASPVSMSDFVAALLASADGPTLLTAIGALAKAGGTMTGNVAMGGNSVTGLATPAAPTDAANKSYVDALATLVSGALVFKGAWDASSGVFPGSGTAQLGWFYRVSVAGTVNGVVFNAGDQVFALANNASTSTYAANWLQVSGNITLAEIQAIVGFTFGTLAAQSSVTASQISDASANGRSLITAANYAAMRTALGLGTAATLDVGTAANKVVQLDGTAKLPAVDGSALTNLPTVTLPRSYLAGFKLSNNSGTPHSKIDVAAGSCRDDSNTVNISLTAGTVDFGVTGANGLDTGLLAVSTWYHLFVIAKADGTTAYFASTSLTPTLPTGYIYKRRLGTRKTDASAYIIAFVQDGDTVMLAAWAADITATNPGTAAVSRTMSTPLGVRVEGIFSAAWVGGSTSPFILLSDLSISDQAPTSVNAIGNFGINSLTGSQEVFSAIRVFTNTSSQIRSRANTSGASDSFYISTVGWVDRRGRDD